MATNNRPTIFWRSWVIGLLMLASLAVLIAQLIRFQLLNTKEYTEESQEYIRQTEDAKPERGTIYDRNHNILAINSNDYEVGIDIPFIESTEMMEKIANEIARILERPYTDIYNELMKYNSERSIYMPLAQRVSPEKGRSLEALNIRAIQLKPIPRRFYPENNLMCHLLGYVSLDTDAGGAGLEGFYDKELAGEGSPREIFIMPEGVNPAQKPQRGLDLVLTIDRTIQQTVERHLQEAITEYGAEGGSILVMDPQTGAMVAMANSNCFSPSEYGETPELLSDPATAEQYDPGSVMKLVTLAAGIDSGKISANSTFYDSGVFQTGDAKIYNSENTVYGTIDMETALKYSVNTAMIWVAQTMGEDIFLDYLQKFGFGRPSGIDLSAEAAGTVNRPGSADWSDSTLATMSFGQGISTTPIQIVAAIGAIANKGKLMQPYVVQSIYRDGELYNRREPRPQGFPISPSTAEQITAMAVKTVAENYKLRVDGYTLAGKTGTAEISIPGVGYHPNEYITSFVGWLPADNPQLIMLVKLDRPSLAKWGSTSAAPAAAKLANELVGLLDIAPDYIRQEVNQ